MSRAPAPLLEEPPSRRTLPAPSLAALPDRIRTSPDTPDSADPDAMPTSPLEAAWSDDLSRRFPDFSGDEASTPYARL